MLKFSRGTPKEAAPAEGEDSAEAEAHFGSFQEELKVRSIAISTAVGRPLQKSGAQAPQSVRG